MERELLIGLVVAIVSLAGAWAGWLTLQIIRLHKKVNSIQSFLGLVDWKKLPNRTLNDNIINEH